MEIESDSTSMDFNEYEENCIELSKKEYKQLLKDLNKDDYTPDYNIQGRLMACDGEYMIIAKGKLNNYFLIYI